MWHILLGMISTASLAAFSASLVPSLGTSGTAPARVTPIGSPSARASDAGTKREGAGTLTQPVLKPGQILPRGSVLNLSV